MAIGPQKEVEVTINGVSVKIYIIDVEVTEMRNGIRTATLALDHTLVDYINIRNGLSVEVIMNYVGGTTTYKKFSGLINSYQDSVSGILIQCVDDSWKATGETVTKVYKSTDSFGGDPANILIDLYGFVNLTADNTTIDPTPVILPEITCDSAYVSAKTSSIATALGWDEWYNPTDSKMYVSNPDLYTTRTTPLTVGTNVVNFPEYNDNIFQTINEIELQGVSSDTAYQESFNGDGTSTKFTLGRTPLSTYIYVTVGGVEQVGTVDGASSTYDYLINKQQGFIEFASGSIPAAGTSNVVVNYTATELTSITVDDETSQVNNTKRKIVISVKDAITVDDALVRGNNMIQQSKENYYNFSCSVTNILDMSCRNKADYNDQTNSIYLSNMYVNKIVWKWPDFTDEVTLGTKPFNVNNMFYNTEERVMSLERKRQEGQILTINKLNNATLKLKVEDMAIQQVSLDAVTSVTLPVDVATQIYRTGSTGPWNDIDNVQGVGNSITTATIPQEVVCYVDPVTVAATSIENSKIVGISVDITGYTTGTGSTTISDIQLLKNYLPVGDIKSSTDSFSNVSSTVTVGSSSEDWGLVYDYNDIHREGFGVRIKLINGATSINLSGVAIKLHYRPILSSTDIVKGATKFVKADYDAGTETTVPSVTYTNTIDDELEIIGTI